MKDNIIPIIKEFMEKEKIDFSISEDNSSDFWLDDKKSTITVRFKVNSPEHEIFYDVYSTEYSNHLTEKTIKDVERLDYIAEDNRRWKIAEIIEDIWLILDQIKLWAMQNNYTLIEKQLI